MWNSPSYFFMQETSLRRSSGAPEAKRARAQSMSMGAKVFTVLGILGAWVGGVPR